MDDVSQKILLTIAGAISGWGLKTVAELVSTRRQSTRALWLLEAELQTIRVQVSFVNQFLHEAEAMAFQRNPKAEESLATSQQLARALPQVSIYATRFDQIAPAFTQGELEIAKQTISYYNIMRAAFPERVPDISGLATVELIAGNRHYLRHPLAWLRIRTVIFAFGEERTTWLPGLEQRPTRPSRLRFRF